jgi:hypothetical protein
MSGSFEVLQTDGSIVVSVLCFQYVDAFLFVFDS